MFGADAPAKKRESNERVRLRRFHSQPAETSLQERPGRDLDELALKDQGQRDDDRVHPCVQDGVVCVVKPLPTVAGRSDVAEKVKAAGKGIQNECKRIFVVSYFYYGCDNCLQNN